MVCVGSGIYQHRFAMDGDFNRERVCMSVPAGESSNISTIDHQKVIRVFPTVAHCEIAAIRKCSR